MQSRMTSGRVMWSNRPINSSSVNAGKLPATSMATYFLNWFLGMRRKLCYHRERARQKGEARESGGVGTMRLGHSENPPTPGIQLRVLGGRGCLQSCETQDDLDDQRRWLGQRLPRVGRLRSGPLLLTVLPRLSPPSFSTWNSSSAPLRVWVILKPREHKGQCTAFGSWLLLCHFILHIVKALFPGLLSCHQL